MGKRLAGLWRCSRSRARRPARTRPTPCSRCRTPGSTPITRSSATRRARALQAPWTYILNYPTTAKPLNLTLDAANYRAAVKKDCALWRSVKRGQLYYVPGTRIVGAISFQDAGGLTCPPPTTATDPTGTPFILDTQGHGTMTASRAASSEYGACRTCLIVSVQFPSSAGNATSGTYAALDWLNANTGWIDAESPLVGPDRLRRLDPSGRATSTRRARARAAQRAQRAGPLASGRRGTAWRGAGRRGAAGHETAPQLGPSVISVGGHDSGYVSAWAGFPPTVVSDDCNDWGAYNNSLDRSEATVGSGTSSATPFAAGGAVRILRDAREILGDTSTGVHDGIAASGPAGSSRRRARSPTASSPSPSGATTC